MKYRTKVASDLFALIAIVSLAATLFSGASVARGDWIPGDPYKMHFPQLPDPQGWDVNFTFPKVLADDWLCTETGPVQDVHFWFSFQHDLIAPITGVHVSIHSDIPDPDGPFGPLYSKPGEVLWERHFAPTDSELTIRGPFSGMQGWLDPNPPVTAQRPDHQTFYQMNIENIRQPFIQEQGKIYWLDLWMTLANPDARVGWKTSLEHFQDDAVWDDLPLGAAPWQELRDPTGISLDMAFVITPEPTMAVLGLCGMSLLRRRR